MIFGLHSRKQQKDPDALQLVMTLLVRDEVDIIRANIDYHLSDGVDYFIVMDNGSVDGTVEILEEYARQDILELIHEPSKDFRQDEWVTIMARRAYEQYGADWVINADSDEFYLHRPGSLKEGLSQIPPRYSHFRAPRTNFIPFEGQDESLPPPLSMIYREKVSYNWSGKILPGKAIHRGSSSVHVGFGNHRVKMREGRRWQGQSPVEVFHYPLRNYDQFVSKSSNQGSGLEQNVTITEDVGVHARAWYDLLNRDELRKTYQEKYFYTKERLEQALQSEELVEDRLLADRLKRIYQNI